MCCAFIFFLIILLQVPHSEMAYWVIWWRWKKKMYTTLPLVLILCTVLQVGSQFSWIKHKHEALLNFVMQGEKTSLHKNNLFGRTAKSNNAFSSSIKMLLKFSYCRCSGFDVISSPQAWGGGKIKVFFLHSRWEVEVRAVGN